MHWRCTGKPGRARDAPSFKCKRCLWDARAIHVQPNDKIYTDGEPLESVDSFCYLGDMLSAGDGCESAVITRGRSAWGKYRDLLPILSSKNVALGTKGRVYDTYIRSAMLYGSETWALTEYSKMKEEFLEKYIESGWMKELVVQICAGGLA